MSLIERCKDQSAFGNACTGGANLKNHFSPLAPPVQTEKLLFDPYTIGANRKICFWAVAPVVQIAKTSFWPLHRRYKHFQKRFGHRMAPIGFLCWRYSYIGLT